MPGLVPFVYGEPKYGTTFSYCPSGWTLGREWNNAWKCHRGNVKKCSADEFNINRAKAMDNINLHFCLFVCFQMAVHVIATKPASTPIPVNGSKIKFLYSIAVGLSLWITCQTHWKHNYSWEQESRM